MPVGDGWDLPPGAEPWSDFHWFSCGPRNDLEIIILSERPVWYTGHYYGGRMAPCSGPGCDACAAAVGAQVRYCFAVAESVSRRAGLMEMGRSNGLQIQDWMHRNGGLRGMRLMVRKHSRSPQSRTDLTFIEEPCPLWAAQLIPPDPSLALYLTWHKAGFAMPQEFSESMSFLLRGKTPARG